MQAYELAKTTYILGCKFSIEIHLSYDRYKNEHVLYVNFDSSMKISRINDKRNCFANPIKICSKKI